MLQKGKFKTLLFVLCIIIVFPIFCFSQSVNHIYCEKPIFEKLTSIKNIDSLTEYYNSIAIPDPVVKIVYASRRCALRGSSDDEIFLLSVIPQSDLEVSNLGILSDPKSEKWDVNITIDQIQYNCIDQSSKAVIKHPEYLPNYFRYVASTDGELAEIFESTCASVIEQICVEFLTTLSKMHPELEMSVMRLFEAEGFNDDCIRKNIDKIPPKYIEWFDCILGK